MCYDPNSKRVYVSPHARFVETDFPGLAQTTRPTVSPHVTVAQAPSPPAPPDAAEPQYTTEDANAEQPDNAGTQEAHENDTHANGESTIAQRLSRR
eukprot:5000044-Pleurochrysis_carterae.AAC.1